MDISDQATHVHDQLVAAAALGDERTQQIAGALTSAADAAVRLALLDAVSVAAREITAALFEAELPGTPAISVDIAGPQLNFRVTVTSSEPEEAPRVDDGEANARISFRLSEALKAQIEQAAGQESISVNTWLGRAAAAALAGRGGGRPGWGPGGWPGGWSGGFGPGAGWGTPGGRGPGGNHVTGWVTG